ncbi:MAG TPA: TlpA disulfide reductase family protein [Pyrinomonadaceae bacterium]|nr:TlpA disulfide reductase family protein [Pyrinomonadaceae bacterium]
MGKKRVIFFGVLAALVASVWLSTSRLNASDKGGSSAGALATSRRPLPSHRLLDLNRQEVAADDLSRGRVLLVFMTTSCEPCVEEAKIIARLHAAAPPGLKIYGVSFERPAQVATFVKEFDLKFTMLTDANAQLIRALDIHHFPTTLLLEDGLITAARRGVTRDEADLYRQLGIH